MITLLIQKPTWNIFFGDGGLFSLLILIWMQSLISVWGSCCPAQTNHAHFTWILHAPFLIAWLTSERYKNLLWMRLCCEVLSLFFNKPFTWCACVCLALICELLPVFLTLFTGHNSDLVTPLPGIGFWVYPVFWPWFLILFWCSSFLSGNQ